jgi:hypothetical protein
MGYSPEQSGVTIAIHRAADVVALNGRYSWHQRRRGERLRHEQVDDMRGLLWTSRDRPGIDVIEPAADQREPRGKAPAATPPDRGSTGRPFAGALRPRAAVVAGMHDLGGNQSPVDTVGRRRASARRVTRITRVSDRTVKEDSECAVSPRRRNDRSHGLRGLILRTDNERQSVLASPVRRVAWLLVSLPLRGSRSPAEIGRLRPGRRRKRQIVKLRARKHAAPRRPAPTLRVTPITKLAGGKGAGSDSPAWSAGCARPFKGDLVRAATLSPVLPGINQPLVRSRQSRTNSKEPIDDIRS